MADSRIRTLTPFFRLPSIWDEEEWPSFNTSQNLDVYETDNEVVVKAAVPGIPADKVDVTFEDGVLRVSGRVEEKEEEKKKRQVVHYEHRARMFDYTTTLPRAIDAGKISAEVEDGVVTVMAPIAEASKPKKITVRAKGK